MNFTNVSLASFGLEKELERELAYKNIKFTKIDRLYFLEKDYCPIFAQVTWKQCQKITIESIGDGIKKLKALGRNWALFSINNHRRAELIQDGLYKLKDNKIKFLEPEPKYPMGGWTLLDANTIACSTETTSKYPLGRIEFEEDKTVPSRAYLKLWEFFTVYESELPTGTVIDLGSSPGGWTWVLAKMGLPVISVDKAPLDAKLQNLKNIRFINESAFSLNPKDFPEVEWLFSDIICYPERLLNLINNWRENSNVKHFVCTIKFQGDTDFKIIDEFLKIPNSKVIKLYNNKHEIMFSAKSPTN